MTTPDRVQRKLSPNPMMAILNRYQDPAPKVEEKGPIGLGKSSPKVNDDWDQMSDGTSGTCRSIAESNKSIMREIEDFSYKREGDDSPIAIQPDPEPKEGNARPCRTIVYIVLIMLSATLIGLVVGLVFVLYDGDQGDSSPSPSNHASANDPGHRECNITEVEDLCILNKPFGLGAGVIPKCVHDYYDVVFVRTGTSIFFTREEEKPSITACTDDSMALRALAAKEYEHPSSSGRLLDCDYNLLLRYYQQGMVEWWTDEGAYATGACSTEGVVCDDEGSVVMFHIGEDDKACFMTDMTF